MAKNEKTSKDIASIAAKGLKDPGSLTKKQIQKLAGAVLTQAPDKPKAAKPPVAAKPTGPAKPLVPAKPKVAANPVAPDKPKAAAKPKTPAAKSKKK